MMYKNANASVGGRGGNCGGQQHCKSTFLMPFPFWPVPWALCSAQPWRTPWPDEGDPSGPGTNPLWQQHVTQTPGRRGRGHQLWLPHPFERSEFKSHREGVQRAGLMALRSQNSLLSGILALTHLCSRQHPTWAWVSLNGGGNTMTSPTPSHVIINKDFREKRNLSRSILPSLNSPSAEVYFPPYRRCLLSRQNIFPVPNLTWVLKLTSKINQPCR